MIYHFLFVVNVQNSLLVFRVILMNLGVLDIVVIILVIRVVLMQCYIEYHYPA